MYSKNFFKNTYGHFATLCFVLPLVRQMLQNYVTMSNFSSFTPEYTQLTSQNEHAMSYKTIHYDKDIIYH